MTAEQLEEARAERMRQNGHGAITIEDVRTWIEETGLCIFLPRSAQAGQSILTGATATPTFVEAVAGQRTNEPSLELIREAESLLVRLEAEGVAVRLNLGGQPLSPSGDQPDYIVAGWVLPYIYALRGDRDWRRSPQLTGSRQVSQLAVLAAKQIDSANMTATEIRDALGREVTEAAVLRALHELWKQLRIIPVVPEVGVPGLWQPLRQRFQKAIAEGASTSQVTAISVLASIYLQAVIAASMEDIEAFLSPLTSRSKIREVVRGLAATRQVHSTNMGHSPMFYVAGTLPEFPAVPSFQISSATPSYRSTNYRGSTYLHSYLGHAQEDEAFEPVPERTSTTRVETPREATLEIAAVAFEATVAAPSNGHTIGNHAHAAAPSKSAEEARAVSRPKPAGAAKSPASKSPAPRPRTARTPVRTPAAAHPRERSRTGSGAASGNSSRSNGASASSSRPVRNGSYSANGNGNGSHAAKPAHSNGNGHGAKATTNGFHGANGANGPSGTAKSNGASSAKSAKPASNGWSARPAGKASANGAKGAISARPAARGGSAKPNGTGTRAASSFKPSPKPAARPAAGSARPAAAKRTAADGASRKPAPSASKRYSFAGQAKQAPKPAAKFSGRTSGTASKSAGARSKAARPSQSSRPAESKRRG